MPHCTKKDFVAYRVVVCEAIELLFGMVSGLGPGIG